VGFVRNDVSDERSASIIRVERISELRTLTITSLMFLIFHDDLIESNSRYGTIFSPPTDNW
jgi:hypothetical protein